MVTVTDTHVEFCFYRPQADRVEILGDFNDWREGELLMQPTPDGYWRASLLLPAGVYTFRYRADGEWFTDYAAFGIEPGEHGMNSIVRVAPAPVAGQAQAAPDRRSA